MTANYFGVANCTASKVIFEVCSAICSVLGPSYLYLPRDQEEMKMKVAEFEAKFGMFQTSVSDIWRYRWYTYLSNGSIYKFARLLQL